MNQPRLSLTDQSTLRNLADCYWIDVDRSAPHQFSRLCQLGLASYHAPMHSYVITANGFAWLNQNTDWTPLPPYTHGREVAATKSGSIN